MCRSGPHPQEARLGAITKMCGKKKEREELRHVPKANGSELGKWPRHFAGH